MKLKTILFAIILSVCASTFALDVATGELSKAKKVDFINYSGAVANPPDYNEVSKIGKSLAEISQRNGRAAYLLKYSVVRAHSDEKDLLSADIFSIDPQAKVNHVNTLRKILSSYYLRRFNYTQSESDLLGVVTTYYNAIYRGDMSYFSTQYQKIVTAKINSSNAGLSTRYYEWPGKTKILIPLSEGNGHPDIFKLADPKTTEEIRKKTDKGIPERKEIVKLKEAEIIKEKDTIAKKEDENNKSKENLTKKENQIEQKKTDLEKEKSKIAEEKKKADEIKNPSDKERAKETVAKKESEVQQKEKEIKKEDDSITKQKEETATKEKEIEKKKEDVSQKEDSLKKEKSLISKDEKTIPNKDSDQKKENTDKQADLARQQADLDKKSKDIALKEEEVKAKLDKVYKEKLYYLKVNNWFNDGIYNNEMIVINPLSRKIILKSPYTTIAGRKFDIFAKGVVVIGFEGKTGANFEHRLVLLDADKLTAIAVGKDIIFWRSFVEVRDGQIYSILSLNGKYYLARYSDTLERLTQSKSEVDKDSTISFYGDYIYVNSPDKKIMVLNKNDLSFLEKIDPDKDFDR